MKNIFETIIGFLVLFIGAIFINIAYQSSDAKIDENNFYTINAVFENVDGIKVGSEVKISGIVVGKVISQSLDYNIYAAQVKMLIDKKVKLPEDSSVQILSVNILGDKYIAITPGTEENLLEDGSFIEFTQSSINLETLISKFIFGLKDNSSQSKSDENNFLEGKKSDNQNYIFNDSSSESTIS